MRKKVTPGSKTQTIPRFFIFNISLGFMMSRWSTVIAPSLIATEIPPISSNSLTCIFNLKSSLAAEDSIFSDCFGLKPPLSHKTSHRVLLQTTYHIQFWHRLQDFFCILKVLYALLKMLV